MATQTPTRDKIAERRLARMRMGQSICVFSTLRSDPEIRLALVPLTEAEYTQALNAVAADLVPDGLIGAEIQDRRRAQETLIRAVREPDDLTTRVYATADELMDDVEVGDIDHLIDEYNRMVADSSPALDGIPPEEFRNLKELLQTMDWNALSGRAWYAANRFLSEIMPSPLLDNSPGSSFNKLSTTTSE